MKNRVKLYQMKAFADGKIGITQNMKLVFEYAENIVEKENILLGRIFFLSQ